MTDDYDSSWFGVGHGWIRKLLVDLRSPGEVICRGEGTCCTSGATRRVRVGTLGDGISKGRAVLDAIHAHGLPFAFLMKKLALDKVGGFLRLRSGGNQQARIRFEPRNPRLEIRCGVFKSLLLDSRDAAQHGGSHFGDELLFRIGFRAKGNRVLEVFSM